MLNRRWTTPVMTKIVVAIALLSVAVVTSVESANAARKGRRAAKRCCCSDPMVSIFDGKTLNGWKQINGTATYTVENGTIVGTTVPGSPNSFLCSEKHYGDFELVFDVKVDTQLNSGCQIRSNSMPEYHNGRVHGYQVEISTNGEAGFIYDEARRGWLSKDRSNEAARAAFKDGEWNSYRIVCNGDSLKTWINGVPVADVTDSMTPSGFIGLQVHAVGGDPKWQVRWRNLKLRELN